MSSRFLFMSSWFPSMSSRFPSMSSRFPSMSSSSHPCLVGSHPCLVVPMHHEASDGPLWALLGHLALNYLYLGPLWVLLGPLALLDPLGLLGPLALILFLIIRFSGRPVSRSGRRAAMGGASPPPNPP